MANRTCWCQSSRQYSAVNPDGGSGRIIGMVLALFLLQIIESGFNILGISPYLTMALWGTLLLCFIQARGMLGLDRVV